MQIDGETGEQLTASLLVKRSIKLSKWLTEQGVGVGSNISINSENRLEFCIVAVGTLFSGGTFAPLNPEYTPRKTYIHSYLYHCLHLTCRQAYQYIVITLLYIGPICSDNDINISNLEMFQYYFVTYLFWKVGYKVH